MAADNIVRKAIAEVLRHGDEQFISHLLDVGFYDPVSNEPLRFIVYAIRALHKRGNKVTLHNIKDYLDKNTTRMTAFMAKRELQTIEY